VNRLARSAPDRHGLIFAKRLALGQEILINLTKA